MINVYSILRSFLHTSFQLFIYVLWFLFVHLCINYRHCFSCAPKTGQFTTGKTVYLYMSLWMRFCMYVCVCLYVCMCVRARVRVYICMSSTSSATETKVTSNFTFIFAQCAWRYVCLSMSFYACTYVHTYTMYIQKYTYKHTYICMIVPVHA